MKVLLLILQQIQLRQMIVTKIDINSVTVYLEDQILCFTIRAVELTLNSNLKKEYAAAHAKHLNRLSGGKHEEAVTGERVGWLDAQKHYCLSHITVHLGLKCLMIKIRNVLVKQIDK